MLAATGGEPDFSALHFTVNGSKFFYGRFVNALIAFLILAAVVEFFVVVPMGRLLERYRPAPDAMKDCPECLSSIPAAAGKCAFCASPQVQVSVQAKVPSDSA